MLIKRFDCKPIAFYAAAESQHSPLAKNRLALLVGSYQAAGQILRHFYDPVAFRNVLFDYNSI
jgi:hypothetical protein